VKKKKLKTFSAPIFYMIYIRVLYTISSFLF